MSSDLNPSLGFGVGNSKKGHIIVVHLIAPTSCGKPMDSIPLSKLVENPMT